MNLFQDAIPFYEKAIPELSDRELKEKAQLRLADCHRLLGNFEEAETQYEKLYKRNKRKGNPELILNYGQALKASAKYEEAKKIFEQYVERVPDDPMGPLYVESCDLAQQWLYESIGLDVRNMRAWNSEAPDFAPAFYGQQVVFCSSREGSKKPIISFNPNQVETMLDFYQAELKVVDDAPLPAQPLAGLNTFLHEGPATFSPDLNEVFFTRTIVGKRDKKNKAATVVNTLQIFYAKKDTAGNWGQAVSNFPLNSLQYSVGHPSLSADGKYLYFMSDMPGGFGQTDIYRIERTSDTTWGKAENLGPEVNTFGYELYPYIHESGTLYFSSNTHPGMGKLDIFKATFDGEIFNDVQNLKPPINSIGDDFGLVLDYTERKGFFSSDRANGMGREDIHSFMDDYPIEIALVGDTFVLEDLSLYGSIDYKLKYLNSETEVPIYYVNGKYKFILPSEDSLFSLSIRKQGFPFNRVELSKKSLSNTHYFEANIKAKLKSVQFLGVVKDKEVIQGVQFNPIPQVDTTQPPRFDTVYISKVNYYPVPETKVIIEVNGQQQQEIITDAIGKYRLSEAFNPLTTYKIIAPIGERVERVKLEESKPNPIQATQAEDEFVHFKGVIEINGNPIPFAQIAVDVNEIGQQFFQSDNQGGYHFKLKKGQIADVIVSKQGYKTNNTELNTGIYANGDTVELNIGMLKKDMIKVLGRIQDEDSTLLPNTLVTLTSDGKVLGQSATNDKGEFTFSLLAGEEYKVIAAKQGYVSNEKLIDKSQTDTAGRFEFALEKDQQYTISAIKPGYLPVEKDVSTEDLTSNKPIEMDIVLEKIKKNKTVRIENIYYDFNASVFNVSALPELAKLIDFLNLNPTVKIELASHTDSRGKNDYNLKLSQQRANKVVLFLHLEGIDKNRIVAKGYGETAPLNDCVDGIECDELKHSENRRTEFKILSY